MECLIRKVRLLAGLVPVCILLGFAAQLPVVGGIGLHAHQWSLAIELKAHQTHPSITDSNGPGGLHTRFNRGLSPVLIVRQHLPDLATGGVVVHTPRLSVLMTAQNEEDLLILADQFFPDHLRRIVDWVDRMPVHDGVRCALAILSQIVMRRNDRRQAGIGLHHGCSPCQRIVGGIELKADMQEAIPARLEDLRAIGPAIMAGNVPGLVFEEFGFGPEHGPEILQPARMKHSQRARQIIHVDFCRARCLRRKLRIGPHRVVIMVARNDRKGCLSRDQAEAFMGFRHFHGQGLVTGGEVRVHDRVGNRLEAPRRMLRVHRQCLMLPDITQRGNKGDITALAFQIVGNVLHLLQEQLIGVERKALCHLMGVVQIILSIRQNGNRETRILLGPGIGDLLRRRRRDGNPLGWRRRAAGGQQDG